MPVFDHTSFGQAFAGPGMDTRQWVSFGIVDPETPEAPSVEFTDQGPLVNVTLQPSGTPVRARVAMGCGGVGEGEYHPFIDGDEVILVIPEGNERAGCTIIGRMSNNIDKFPSVVAGADVTKNVASFKRVRPPYIIESAYAVLIRNATKSSFLSLDPQGNCTLSNGDGSFLSLNADFLGIQGADGDMILQLDLSKKLALLQAGSAAFALADSGTSQLLVPDQLLIGSSGSAPSAHATTVESVALMLQSAFTALGTLMPGPLIGAVIAGAAIPLVNLNTALTAPLPIAPLQAGIAAALAAKSPDPVTQALFPNVGCPGLLIG